MKKFLLTTACLLVLGGQVVRADDVDPKRCEQEWWNASADVKKFCAAREEAELKKNRLEWEEQSRKEVPKTKPVVPAAVTLVNQANALLKGDPTCSQMRRASKLLDRAGDVYAKSNAKEAGDGTLRHLSRRVSWLEDRADEGECRK
jgi:hypothetical protein